MSQSAFTKLRRQGVGCFLAFFVVVMADLTGPAVTWDTCSINLRRISLLNSNFSAVRPPAAYGTKVQYP